MLNENSISNHQESQNTLIKQLDMTIIKQNRSEFRNKVDSSLIRSSNEKENIISTKLSIGE